MSEAELATLLADVARRAGGWSYLSRVVGSADRGGDRVTANHVCAQGEGLRATAVTLRPSSPSKAVRRDKPYLPTFVIGALRTMCASLRVTFFAFASDLIWSSLTSNTGVTPGFHVTKNSSQSGL
jgi:hypothetical protein